MEVWFDRSELRGGDAWDQNIRREIRDCALFIPIISEHSQKRPEGYFRNRHRRSGLRKSDRRRVRLAKREGQAIRVAGARLLAA
ncbi:MAG: TIR domain-containing protein [Steroidobacteraceae bacterium]